MDIWDLHLFEVVTRIEDNIVVGRDSFFDGDEFVVCCTDFDFASVPLVVIADENKVMAFRFVDGMDGDLDRFVDLFDEDSHFGGHAGTDGFWWINNLDVGGVFFDVRAPPVARFSVLVDFDYAA